MARSKKWLIENVNKIMGIISAFAVLLAFVYCPLTVYKADTTSVYSDSYTSVTNLVFPSGNVTDGYVWYTNSNYTLPYIYPTQTDKVVRTGSLELEKGKSYRIVLSFDAFGFNKYCGYGGYDWDWKYTTENLHVIPRVIINDTEFMLNYSGSGNSYIFEFTNDTDYVGVEFHLDYYVELISGNPKYGNILESINVPEIMFDVYEVENVTYEDVCYYEPIYSYQCLTFGETTLEPFVLSPEAMSESHQYLLKYGDNVNLNAGQYKLHLIREGLSYTSLNFDAISDYANMHSKYIERNYLEIGDDTFVIEQGYPSSMYTINASGGILPINYVVQDAYYLNNNITQQISIPAKLTSFDTKFYLYQLKSGSGGTVVEPPIGDTEEPDSGTEDSGGSDDEYNGELDSEFSDALDKSSELDDVVADAEVSKPDIDKIDVDISDLVSEDDIAKVTDLLSILTERNIVKDFILISLTIALVGYVFFGKR